MLQLKNIEISDKFWIDPMLKLSDFKGSEYNFTNNFVWAKAYNIKISQLDGFYIVASNADSLPSFLFPAGSGDLERVVNKMLDFNNGNMLMHGITQQNLEFLQQYFGGRFTFKQDRNSFDYIYNSTDLISLVGKKYASKRNHINRFKETEYSYVEVTRDNIDLCLQMNKEWCKKNNCLSDESKQTEFYTTRLSLKNFDALGLVGGMIKQGERVVAYSLGERLNSDTFIVHIEKAFSDVQGAYPIINQEFALRHAKDYAFINREDDVGVEGLRKAKLSYYPAFLLKKYFVEFKK
jgi:hypothetical protein